MQLFYRNPAQLRSVVARLQGADVGHLTGEEEVERVDGKPAVGVLIGEREEETAMGNGKVGFLFHLSAQRLLDGFAEIAEAAGEVECSPFGITLPYRYQKLVVLVRDKGGNGSAGVKEIFKTAIVATLAFLVLDGEMPASAGRAILKLI